MKKTVNLRYRASSYHKSIILECLATFKGISIKEFHEHYCSIVGDNAICYTSIAKFLAELENEGKIKSTQYIYKKKYSL